MKYFLFLLLSGCAAGSSWNASFLDDAPSGKDILRAKTISEVIYAELQEAHLRKLEAETAAEYSDAAIKYNSRRIERLKQRLFEHAGEDT